jgi:hypothetical protein
MKLIQQRSKCAELLDHVAGMPPGTPFALAAPTRQTLFLGTRLTHTGAPVPQGLAQASGTELLKAFVTPAVSGLPVAAFIDAFQNARATTKTSPPDMPKVLWQGQPSAPAYYDFFARLRKAQEERKLSPGKPPEVLKLGDTTFTVHDNITLIGDLTLVGDVVVPAPKTVAVPQPKTGEAQSSDHVLLADPQKANEVVNFIGEGVDTLSKCFPDLDRQVAGAGEIVDGLAIVTSGVGFVDAIHQGNNRALVGCSLTLGAAAVDLLGTFTCNASLHNVALLLKFSKTGWTLFCPSKDRTR